MECSQMKRTAEDSRNQLPRCCRGEGWAGAGGGAEEELVWFGHSGSKGRWRKPSPGLANCQCQASDRGVGGSPSGKERQTFIHLEGGAQPMGEGGMDSPQERGWVKKSPNSEGPGGN